MKAMTAAIALLLAAGPDAGPNAVFQYEFNDVSGKVLLDHQEATTPVANGDLGVSGDQVRTGWRGRAEVSVEDWASHFEVYPGSKVLLASERPGVLVVVERGRLKAWFDALIGKDGERLVEAPGAILAVRGTRYGVEVDRYDNTTLTVFEGSVEVIPTSPGIEPWVVGPGEISMFGRRGDGAGRTMPMPPGMSESSWNSKGSKEMGQPGSMMAPGREGHAPSGQPRQGHHGFRS